MNLLDRIRQYWVVGRARHYSEIDLLAFKDCEISGDRGKKIGAHLQKCAQCRSKAAELRELLSFSDGLHAPSRSDSFIDEGFCELQSSIRSWSARARDGDLSDDLPPIEELVLSHEIRSELELWLGTRTTKLIAEEFACSACSPKKAFESIEFIFQNFLGCREGTALARTLAPLRSLHAGTGAEALLQ